MNQRIALLALGLFGAGMGRAELRELSFMTAMPVKEPPVVDGVVDDAAWKVGVANRNYYKYLDAKGTHFTNFVTTCAIVFDDKGVYAGVVNYDPCIGKLHRTVVKDNDPMIWRDDCAELYFDPGANGVGFYKFVVNANGKNDACWRMDSANVHEEWRAPGVVSAAKVFDDRWEFELFVPWEAYGLKGRPDAGTFWTFNHSRFCWTTGQFSSSAPCAGGTMPQRFGTLYFSDGNAPTAERILKMLEERQQSDWGIQIGAKTYLHTLAGTEAIDVSLPDLIAQKEKEEKHAAAICVTNIAKVLSGPEPVPVLKLDLAGTYDFGPEKEFDGYSGWYRHNADPSVVGDHLIWAEKVTDRPRVLFLTGLGGAMRDAVELAARYDIEADIMSAAFGLNGIWEDCVKGGTYLDKCRQIESLLAKDPDVVIVTEYNSWDGIPARYRLEILRRVRDEGMGLVFTGWMMRGRFKTAVRDDLARDELANRAPFAEIPGFQVPKTDKRGNGTAKLIDCLRLGKGRIVHDDFFMCRWNLEDPDWLTFWAGAFETRSAHYFNLIRAAQNREENVTFAFVREGEHRQDFDEKSVFLPFEVKVEKLGLFTSAELRLRLRDRWNNVLRDETRPLAEGANAFCYPVKDLAGGDYVLDLIASVGGAVDAVAFRPLTVANRCGRFEIAMGQTNLMQRVVKSPVSVSPSWTTPLSVPLVCKVALKTLPYGDTVWTREDKVQPNARFSPSISLGNTLFPTKAGYVEAALYTTNGVKVADAKRTYFFPNDDHEPYTLIMWDSLRVAGGHLVPFLAKSVTGEFGYQNHLGETGFCSALFDSRSVPTVAYVSLDKADNGGVYWGHWGGTFGWGGPNVEYKKQFEGKKAQEINPYDPRVKEAFEKFFAPKIGKIAPFGVCVWNLGDENRFTYEAGNGPQDKEPFVKFLKEKYGTVAKFNEVHGTNVASFAEAPHMVKSVAIAAKDWPAYFDHVQYMDRMYSDFYQMMSKIIKRYDPKARVGAEGSNAGELEQTVANLEFWGPYRSMVSDELLRNLDPNKVRGIWWGGYFDNMRDGFPVQQWEYVLTGTLNADQWFALAPGGSQGAYGGDFKLAPYVAKMLPYLKTIRRGMAQSFLATPFRDDGFAQYMSYASGHASTLDEAYPSGDGHGVLVRFCYRKGYGVKMITPRTLKKLDTTKVLFLSGASALSDAEVAAFKVWQKKGGLLMSDCEPGVLDGFLAKRKEAPLKGVWTPYKWDSSDAELSAILAKKGIVNKESIAGIPAASCIFRVRELDGLRLVGFKCVKKDLGRKVTIDLGDAGTVYEFDTGKCLGKLSKIEIDSLDVPFKCYAVFKDAPSAPDAKALVPGRVYRLMAFDAKGNEIEYRTKVFTAKKGVDPLKSFFVPVDEKPGTTYRLRDVNSGLEGEVILGKESQRTSDN